MRLFSQIRRDLSSMMNVVDASRQPDILVLVDQVLFPIHITIFILYSVLRIKMKLLRISHERQPKHLRICNRYTLFALRYRNDYSFVTNHWKLTQSAGKWETIMRELIVEFSSSHPFDSGDSADVCLFYSYH